MNFNRRGFLSGLASLVAAPALVKADSLMKCAGVRMAIPGWTLIQPGLALADGAFFQREAFPQLFDVLGSHRLPDFRINCQTLNEALPSNALAEYGIVVDDSTGCPVGSLINLRSQIFSLAFLDAPALACGIDQPPEKLPSGSERQDCRIPHQHRLGHAPEGCRGLAQGRA